MHTFAAKHKVNTYSFFSLMTVYKRSKRQLSSFCILSDFFNCSKFSRVRHGYHACQFLVRKTDCSSIMPSLLYERQAAVSSYPVCYTKDRLQFHHTQFVIRKTGCSFIIPSLLYERQAAVSSYPVCYRKDRLQFHYTQFVIRRADISFIIHTQFVIQKTGCNFIIASFLYERQTAVSLYPLCYTKDRL